MAAPLVALLPAIFSALWAGVVVACKWIVNHAHVVKIVAVCVLMVAAFKVGLIAYQTFTTLASDYLLQIDQSLPNGVSSSAGFLAKANYCLPISEMFALLAVYITFAGLCLGLKFAIASYKAVPFKSA